MRVTSPHAEDERIENPTVVLVGGELTCRPVTEENVRMLLV